MSPSVLEARVQELERQAAELHQAVTRLALVDARVLPAAGRFGAALDTLHEVGKAVAR